MYRTLPRSASKTVVEYAARDVRPEAFFVAILFALVAFGFLLGVHETNIACRRASAYATARCTIDRSGLRPLHAELRAAGVTAFDVRPSRKRPSSARVVLELGPSFTPRVLELDASPFGGGIDIAMADDARDRFLAFQADPSASAYDATLSRSAPMKALLLLVGVTLSALVARIVYEQLRQLRPVRVIVDREREVVVIGPHTVPLARVRDVVVEEGTFRAFVRRKGEPDPPGFRLAVLLDDFEHLPATREWRPGPRAVHELARQQVLDAMTRRPTTES